MASELVGLSFSTVPGRAWYVPVGHRQGKQLPLEEVLGSRQTPASRTSRSPSADTTLNYDVTIHRKTTASEVRGMACDTMMAAYLLGIKAIGLKNLALDMFNFEMTSIKALIGSGSENRRPWTMVPIEDVVPYACADADYSGRLRPILEKRLKDRRILEYLRRRWRCL